MLDEEGDGFKGEEAKQIEEEAGAEVVTGGPQRVRHENVVSVVVGHVKANVPEYNGHKSDAPGCNERTQLRNYERSSLVVIPFLPRSLMCVCMYVCMCVCVSV